MGVEIQYMKNLYKTCLARVKKELKPISFTFVVKLLIAHMNIPC